MDNLLVRLLSRINLCYIDFKSLMSRPIEKWNTRQSQILIFASWWSRLPHSLVVLPKDNTDARDSINQGKTGLPKSNGVLIESMWCRDKSALLIFVPLVGVKITLQSWSEVVPSFGMASLAIGRPRPWPDPISSAIFFEKETAPWGVERSFPSEGTLRGWGKKKVNKVRTLFK